MSSINPSTCPPDVPFWVRIPGVDCDVVGQRVGGAFVGDQFAWCVPSRYPFGVWHRDHSVTVLRPVGEQLPDWEILRQAAEITLRHNEGDPRYLADRLEAEHKAEQAKAEQHAKLEALIEDAARTMHDSTISGELYSARQPWDKLLKVTQEMWLTRARALADAGYLRVVCDGDDS